jgi:outer membrane receptor for ferric coprogen and ferric-rhodotorulic acid
VFVPQTERAVGNTPLKPVVGSNYETGLKGELMDGRSTPRWRVPLRPGNRAVTDVASGFACDDWYCSTAAGKVRSQGVEAEVSGEVLSGLQLFAGYLQHHQVPRRPGQQGRVFSRVDPQAHAARLGRPPCRWTTSAGAPGRLHQPEPHPGLRAHL